MGIRDVRTAVRGFLSANWSATDLAFENEGYEQLTDLNSGQVIPYVFVEVAGGLYQQVSIGAGNARGNYWTSNGLVMLHVMVPVGTGADQASLWCDTLADLFRGLSLDPNIEFQDINIEASGGESDGATWRSTISIIWSQG